MTVAVFGEALTDLVQQPGGTFAPHPGGGPFNVAVALGRLGVDVQFHSRVSTDALGETILARLAAAGVDVGALQRGQEPTTLALAAIGADGSALYSFYLHGTADRLIDYRPLPAAPAIASFGTLSLVLEPGASVYGRHLSELHERGVTTVVDPNIRAQVIDDPDSYRARFRRWLPNIDVLKLSDEDLHFLQLSPAELLDGGASVVIVTRGAAGLQASTVGGEVSVAAAATPIADTIGAGDTVHAAIIAWLRHTGDNPAKVSLDAWERALQYAARAAAITVSRPGADPPWRHEIGES